MRNKCTCDDGEDVCCIQHCSCQGTNSILSLRDRDNKISAGQPDRLKHLECMNPHIPVDMVTYGLNPS